MRNINLSSSSRSLSPILLHSLLFALLHLQLPRLSSRIRKHLHWLVEILIVSREQECAQEAGNGQSDIWPDEVWVLDGVGAGETDDGCYGGVEEAETVDQTLHPCRGAGIGNFVRCYHNEYLSDGGDTVENQLPPEGYIGHLGTGRSVVSTRTGLVHFPLDDRTSNHIDCCELETDKHSSHGFDGVSDFLEEWVYPPGHDRSENDDSQRVEVVHQIIGRSVQFHSRTLGILHSTNPTVREQENRDEEEDSTSPNRSFDLVDK